MRVRYLICAVFIAVSATALAQDSVQSDSSNGVIWVNGFDDAGSTAIAEGRTVLLDFFTEW
jgi:hypothetical protein